MLQRPCKETDRWDFRTWQGRRRERHFGMIPDEPAPTPDRMDQVKEDSRLVLAMPRRELFKISGFSNQVDLSVIESLTEESFFARRPVLVGNLDAKEVRLGLIGMRDGRVLVDSTGKMLHLSPVWPESVREGFAPRVLREVAAVSAERLFGEEGCRVELCGCCNEDVMADVRHSFILIYRCFLNVDEPPAGMVWVEVPLLDSIALEPLSALAAVALLKPAAARRMPKR